MMYNELEQEDILSEVRVGLASIAYADILLRSIWVIHKIRQTPGYIGFPKMFRAPLCRHGAKRFTVSRHENRDLTGSMGKMQQRSVDLRLQVGELWKVFQMRRFLLDLLPQVFDRE